MRRCHSFVVVLLAGLSACGGGPAATKGTAAPRIAVPPARGRFEVVVRATDPNRSVSLLSSGSFDRARHRLALAVDLGEVDPNVGVVHLVVVDETVYVDCPYLARATGASTRWISVRGKPGDVLGMPIIDELGLVGDTTMRFDAQPEGGSAVVSVRYYDVGASIVIEPPPPEQVTDVTALGARGG